MADYGTPINPKPINVKRNVVGEADAATRKKLLAEALRPGPPVKVPPPVKKEKPTTNFMLEARIEDAIDPDAAKQRRLKAEALRSN